MECSPLHKILSRLLLVIITVYVYTVCYDTYNTAAEIPPGFSGDMTPYRAVFTVQRTRGLFGDVTVNWTVVNPTSEILPTEGSVVFREYDTMATFIIYSTSDNVWRMYCSILNEPFWCL